MEKVPQMFPLGTLLDVSLSFSFCVLSACSLSSCSLFVFSLRVLSLCSLFEFSLCSLSHSLLLKRLKHKHCLQKQTAIRRDDRSR